MMQGRVLFVCFNCLLFSFEEVRFYITQKVLSNTSGNWKQYSRKQYLIIKIKNEAQYIPLGFSCSLFDLELEIL